ncbi:MAG: hypothetical protein WC373_01285 [Smithella sp.]
MKTITEAGYKTDEKRDFTSEEFAKAKIVCEFVIELTKAISRSGYYDAHHPVSLEVKKGLYDAFKNALGDCVEIMLTCHDVEDKVDIHISGILDEPFNIRKLTHSNTSDLFVPKLKDYFERKSLNSFVIKKYITPEHFESFIDVMSEPIADTTDSSNLGDYLTKSLVDLDITEVSTVFKSDVVLSRGKLPWRVSIILRRLAKDLKVVPMFRSASEEKMKLIKKQIVEDIIRPLKNSDLLKDLIVNCDVIVNYLTHLMEIDELEKLIIDSLPADEIMPVSQAIFETYKENKDESLKGENDSMAGQRVVYLAKVLKIAAVRIILENTPDTMTFFEKLYEHKIVDFKMLPEKLRFNIQNRKLAGEVISQIDSYIDKTSGASSPEEKESLVLRFQMVMPEFIKRREWSVIERIMKAISGFSAPENGISGTSDVLLSLPDSVFEGCEEILADEYIKADADARNQIKDILTQMKSMCINIVGVIFNKSREPDVLKSVIDLLYKKGDLTRQWALKTFDDQNNLLSVLNIALLVIVKVGHAEDADAVKTCLKHSNPSIRTKALCAIAKLNKKEAENILIEALNDVEEKVRSQAVTLMERELSLSGESVNKLLLFVKDRLQKKNITANESGLIAGLLKAAGKTAGNNKEHMENEIIGITSDLLKEKSGLLKFIKTEPRREQMEIISACLSTLGKTGGTRSRDYLKALSRGNTSLSKAANEAMALLDKALA